MCRVDLLIIISAFVRPRSLSLSLALVSLVPLNMHSRILTRSRHREADGWMGFDDACVCAWATGWTHKKTTCARQRWKSQWLDGCVERDTHRIHLHDLFISRYAKPLSLCIITNFQPSVWAESAGWLLIFLALLYYLRLLQLLYCMYAWPALCASIKIF